MAPAWLRPFCHSAGVPFMHDLRLKSPGALPGATGMQAAGADYRKAEHTDRLGVCWHGPLHGCALPPQVSSTLADGLDGIAALLHGMAVPAGRLSVRACPLTSLGSNLEDSMHKPVAAAAAWLMQL